MDEKVILIDSHESSVIEEKIKHLGIKTLRIPLEAGDYIIGNILIEFKTIDDFFGSLNSGRLFDQLYKMKLSGKKCFLVIIGTYPYIYKELSDITPVLKRISQMKLLCFRSYDVLLLQFAIVEEFIDLIEYFWTKMDTMSYAPIIKKEESIKDIKIDMLGRIKGVGQKRALFLAEHFKLEDLCNMSPKDLSNLVINNRKLGETGKKIYQVFHE